MPTAPKPAVAIDPDWTTITAPPLPAMRPEPPSVRLPDFAETPAGSSGGAIGSMSSAASRASAKAWASLLSALSAALFVSRLA